MAKDKKSVIQSVIEDRYAIYNGDCIEVLADMPESSVHYSVFSPPFSSLFTYSDSERDLGNVSGIDEFNKGFEFFAKHLYRVLIPGRLVSIHCANLVTTLNTHGVIGLQDLRGDLIRAMVASGWVYHSEVTIWKDPVVQMQRTKAIGLLYKQLKKDSSLSRMGLGEYIVTFRKPGKNPQPIEHSEDNYDLDLWQKVAAPIWTDIVQGNTLQKESAREEADEKHICPLQLDVIERCVDLWTNKDDIVLSPFAGIGSEGYQSLKMGRRFVGIELKGSYYAQAVANLKNAVNDPQMKLFT